MARLLGEARVSILPDGTRFKPEAEAAVKKATAGISGKVKLDLDTKGFDAKVAAEGAKIIAMQNAVAKARAADEKQAEREVAARTKMYASMFDQIAKGEANEARQRANTAAGLSRQLNAQLDSIQKVKNAQDKAWASYGKNLLATQKMEDAFAKTREAQAKAYASYSDNINVSQAKAERQAMSLREKISALLSNIAASVHLKDKDAEGDALILREKLKLLLKDVTVKVRATAGSGFSGVISYIRGKFTKDAESAAGAAGGGSGQSFLSKFAGNFNQGHAIAAAVILGLAALPAAVGAVGVLGGIALGAGIVFGAEKLINSQVKTLTAQIKTLTSSIGKPASPATLANQQLAIQSTQGTISTLESSKKLTAAQQQQLSIAKQRLVIQKQTLAASQAQGQGTAAQQQQLKAAQQQLAVLQKQKAAFTQLDNAVKNLKNSFINFAIITSKPLIKPFTDAIQYLSGQLNGPLTTAFTKLFTAVGPLVKPVLISLLEIVQGVLPGLTSMLTRARAPLAAMFIGFGKIVGIKIGDWFRAATPYIKDSARYFLALVGALGSVVTWIIKFGGEAAKAFGDPNLRGFGTMIGQIGNDILRLIVPAFQGWIGVMAPVVKALAEIVTPILNFLTASPGLVKAIAAIAAIWLIWGKAIAIAALAMKLATPVIVAFDAELDANIIGLVVLAIEALAVAVFLVIKNWKPIAGFFVGIWKEIWSGFIGPLINFFTNTIPHAFGVTIDWLKKNWPRLVGLLLIPLTGGMILVAGVIVKYHKQITKFITQAWGHIANVISGVLKPVASVVEGVWNQIYKITKYIWAVIAEVIKIQVLIVVGIIGEAWRGIKNLTGLVWPWVYKTTKDAWGHIENFITGIVKPIVSAVTGAWNTIKSATKTAWDWVYKTTKDAWGHIENAVTGAAKPTSTGVQTAWRNMKGWTSDAWNFILRVTRVAWGKIGPYVIHWAKEMVAAALQDWKNLENWTSVAFQAIYKFIFNPLNKAATWIENNFVKSVESAFRGLVSTVSAIWNGLKRVVAAPINFVITDVWNPFARFVNAGLSIFNIKTRLPPGSPVAFAGGGKVPGFAPGVDNVPAMLSPGEFVLKPQAVAAIGTENLHRLNKVSRKFANGGDVVNDIEKWNGHKYVWGGGANPSTGWDCSSFVNWIVGHDFKLNLPGGGSWGQATNNGAAHGPVAASYNNWNYGRGVPWSAAKKGDLAIEDNGAHIGFIIQDNTAGSSSETLMGFAARSTATGTGYEQFFPSAFHLERFADDRGFGSQVFDNTIGAVLKAAAGFALNGIEGLANGALSHIPGGGPIPPLAKAAIDDIITAAKNKLTGNQSNYQFDNLAVTGPAGEGTSAGELANGKQLYNYLLNNLFGGNKIAAAGATASIWGESTWNPFAQGTGGRGLIGWTPPSTISNAAFNGGMATQLPAILQFVSRSGDGGAIAQMETTRSVTDAANIWGKKVERFGINDVHSTGIALATSFMKNGGLVPSHVFDSGGTLAPGPNMVYNLTGKPEHLTPTGGNGSQNTVTLEIVGGDSDVEQFIVQLIRKYARVKSGGNVQKAFGRNN